ncbi:MAG: bifunctional diaminohydroxyphosphoribosylaminopyrimidine deaminase/5-amino-6-(5-phosphoribosylamino)uracil reductase RibD [Acidobacteriota bacterium]
MMRRALFHAARAQGATAPNPLVGAVVVDAAGVVVGQGHHERAGDPHAETVALTAAGARGRGATMYVTLEPCCHTGRTGPCTDRLLAAEIARVVVATRDPDPRVSGGGIARLRAAGVVVDVGLEEAAARRLNAGFMSAHERGRPLVVVKAATSRDGYISAAPGVRTAISGPAAARRTQLLRAASDAIAVGIGSVLADDPVLTVRDVVRDRPLTRVIFDRQLRTPPAARLLAATGTGRVVVVTAPESLASHGDRVGELQRRGTAVVGATTLDDACRQLLRLDVHSLLVEGGAQLHRAFWETGLVDRVHLIVAPGEVGASGVPLFDGYPVPWSRFIGLNAEPCGEDIWIEADVHWNR